MKAWSRPYSKRGSRQTQGEAKACGTTAAPDVSSMPRPHLLGTPSPEKTLAPERAVSFGSLCYRVHPVEHHKYRQQVPWIGSSQLAAPFAAAASVVLDEGISENFKLFVDHRPVFSA